MTTIMTVSGLGADSGSSCCSCSSGAEALGACDKPSLTIYLNENLKGKKLQDVICHEIVHATLFSYNINLTYDNEELIAMLITTYGN